MLFLHPNQPGRGVRLATCMNLLPAENPAGIRAGLEALSLPLRDRLVAPGADFGVGLWLPAAAAHTLANDPIERAALLDFLESEKLDAFTFNAFPFGNFHSPGLKAAVFEPDWTKPKRAAYTRDVAHFGEAHAQRANWPSSRHLSISTHTGAHLDSHQSEFSSPDKIQNLRAQVATALAQTLVDLEADSLATAHPKKPTNLVLGLEPEPRSLAGDTRELVALWDALDKTQGQPNPAARLGVCLDACHSAVEFESAQGAHQRALGLDRETPRPLAKLQFSSALKLTSPAQNQSAFAALLALDEPVYLHQVTGRSPAGLLRASDLAELRQNPKPWLTQDELRCHFHVPVNLNTHGGLGTTSAFAGELLATLLNAPNTWGTPELHIEIETYTWSLGSFARDPIDGIEAEYRHVIKLLAQAGWHPESPREPIHPKI